MPATYGCAGLGIVYGFGLVCMGGYGYILYVAMVNRVWLLVNISIYHRLVVVQQCLSTGSVHLCPQATSTSRSVQVVLVVC